MLSKIRQVGNKNKIIVQECTYSSASTGNSVMKHQMIGALVKDTFQSGPHFKLTV
jgi:hypothetical protein